LGLTVKYIAETEEDIAQHHRLVWP
jgi:hypothetical protein